MAKIFKIESLDDSRIAPFINLTERQLRDVDRHQPMFIAESPKVISTAIDAGLTPMSILCEEKHINGDAKSIIESQPDMHVFYGERDLLEKITGYKLTRGVLCAMKRPEAKSVKEICENARRVVVIDNVCDTTNIGAIFRAAAALGIEAVVLTPGTCDPLNRRSVRVSMGSVFLVPWTFSSGDWMSELHGMDFMTVAMALRKQSIDIDSPMLKETGRLAIVLGTEGEGLSEEVINSSDYVARIPMFHNVDSLNVASAAAIAFWELSKNKSSIPSTVN